MNGSSLREAILAAKDTELHPLEVPEWGLTIFVRTLTGADAQNFIDQSKKGDSLGRVALLCIANADGTPTFTEEDVPALVKKSMRALKRVQDFAMEVNGLNEDKAAAKNA